MRLNQETLFYPLIFYIRHFKSSFHLRFSLKLSVIHSYKKYKLRNKLDLSKNIWILLNIYRFYVYIHKVHTVFKDDVLA